VHHIPCPSYQHEQPNFPDFLETLLKNDKRQAGAFKKGFVHIWAAH
jgi:hypothetical protein